MTQLTTIPKLTDLVQNPESAYKDDLLKAFVNQEPPKNWVKQNPFANNSNYLPIDKVEILLDTIFSNWKVEVIETKIMFNAISVTVRLHYKRRDNDEWYYHDGVAAKELQTKKDTGNLKPDFSNVAKSAVEMALPIAKSMAIKDAADHIGKIFGRDLARKETVNFVGRMVNIDLEAAKKGVSND